MALNQYVILPHWSARVITHDAITHLTVTHRTLQDINRLFTPPHHNAQTPQHITKTPHQPPPNASPTPPLTLTSPRLPSPRPGELPNLAAKQDARTAPTRGQPSLVRSPRSSLQHPDEGYRARARGHSRPRHRQRQGG